MGIHGVCPQSVTLLNTAHAMVLTPVRNIYIPHPTSQNAAMTREESSIQHVQGGRECNRRLSKRRRMRKRGGFKEGSHCVIRVEKIMIFFLNKKNWIFFI